MNILLIICLLIGLFILYLVINNIYNRRFPYFRFNITNHRLDIDTDDLVGEDLINIGKGVFFVSDQREYIIVTTRDESVKPEDILKVLNDKYNLGAVFVPKENK